MRTIRKGVFETNSSSTHSITIETIGSKKILARPLIKDGVLNIDHLQDYKKKISYSGYILNCESFETKLAIVASYVAGLDEFKMELLNILKERFELIDIKGENYFCPYSECGQNIFPYEGTLEKFTSSLEDLIEIIKDPTKKIIDSEIDN